MLKKEKWRPRAKDNFVILDSEDGKESVALELDNDKLIIAVYNGHDWIVKVKQSLGKNNFWKLEHLIKNYQPSNAAKPTQEGSK